MSVYICARARALAAHASVVFHNRDLTREDAIQILASSPLRNKAFFCLMAQSGLRPDTVCQLRIKDIELDGKIPAMVRISASQTKGEYGAYVTFCGEESIRYLKEYLQTMRKKNTPDDLLFMAYDETEALSTKSISGLFRRTIENLKERGVIQFEQRQSGKPRELRLYSLRKYFRKYAAQMGADVVGFLMGHTLGVDGHYIPKDPEYYRAIYKEKALPFLRFAHETPTETEKTISELREALAQKDRENAELRSRMEEMQREQNAQAIEMSEFKNAQADTDARIAGMEKMLKSLAKKKGGK